MSGRSVGPDLGVSGARKVRRPLGQSWGARLVPPGRSTLPRLLTRSELYRAPHGVETLLPALPASPQSCPTTSLPALHGNRDPERLRDCPRSSAEQVGTKVGSDFKDRPFPLAPTASYSALFVPSNPLGFLLDTGTSLHTLALHFHYLSPPYVQPDPVFWD